MSNDIIIALKDQLQKGYLNLYMVECMNEQFFAFSKYECNVYKRHLLGLSTVDSSCNFIF